MIPSLNQAHSEISPMALISRLKSVPSMIPSMSDKSVKIRGGGASMKSWHLASASPPEKMSVNLRVKMSVKMSVNECEFECKNKCEK